MKKILALTFFISVFISCSDDDGISEAEAQQHAIERMEENAVVINEAFLRTAEIFNAMEEDELHALSTSNSRDGFIKQMLQRTATVFDDVIEESRQEMDWAEPSSFKGEVRLTNAYMFKTYLDGIAKGIEGTNPGTGVLDKFSIFLDEEIETRAGGSGGGIHIESFSWGQNQTGGHRSKPINIDDIRFVKESIEALIMLHENEDDFDAAVDLFGNRNPEQAVLMALLLPAVQMAREAARSGMSQSNNLKQISIAFAPTTVLGITRTKWAQKMRRAAFLAGIYAILHDDFDPTDADYASITPQRTMYEAVCVLTWVAYYDRPK